jgi:DNA-binding LacI/PurR family transcriptional regulator
MSPALTTVRQNGYTIGRQAAQVELERSAGLLTGPSRLFQVETTLVSRQSTAVASH